jgi:hypothetical protein
MKNVPFRWLGLAVLAFAAIALPEVPAVRSGEKPDVAKLIRQLGSDEFDEREKAQRSLEALGEDDLPALRTAAKKTSDAEVRRRLEDVIAAIEVRFTKDPYVFIQKVGGRVLTVDGARPVKAGEAGTMALSVILTDTKFGDADLQRLKGLGKVTCVTLTGTKVTDRGLSVIQSLSNLQYLNIDRTAVTDAGLVHLKPLKNLERLSLADTKVQGKGLDHLKDLKGLWYLVLDGCDVTDGELAHVVALTRLGTLSLSRTKVTDAGLRRLSALPELNHLEVEKTAVTDAGLAEVARMKKLNDLYLEDTRVTEEGIARLRKANPKLRVFEK